MPHPESEHSLKAQLACALKETEDVNALRAKQDAELVALRAEARRLETAARAYIEGHELALARAEAAESALAAALARADAAESNLQRGYDVCGKHLEALAAARRECEFLRAELAATKGNK